MLGSHDFPWKFGMEMEGTSCAICTKPIMEVTDSDELKDSTLLWKIFCFTESIQTILSAFTGENVCFLKKKKKEMKSFKRNSMCGEQLQCSAGDHAAFLSGHVLYRGGSGGAPGRVPCQDERWVLVPFPARLQGLGVPLVWGSQGRNLIH